jgi:MoxR-like ATPase
MPARRGPARVPGDLRVEVGVDVDEPGGNDATLGVDGAPGRRAVVGQITDRDDLVAVDRDVADERVAPRPVDDRPILDHEIMCHGPVPYGGVTFAHHHRAPESVDEVSDALAAHDYLADEGLATSIYLALRLQRPLLLEGEAGVGKTEVAKVLARWTGGELVRLQCYEGIDASQAVYEWDYSRQLLHIRAVEASGSTVNEDELYSQRFLVKRPLLRALDYDAEVPPVLLIDEVDRADDEFEAFLLEILSDWSISVPELGVVHADVPPLAILTSNRTRDVHDALKRRCLYHWIEHPDFERELAILRLRAPEVPDALARDVAAAVEALRAIDLYKPPGVAESLDWAHALATLGAARLDERTVEATLGTILKYREDQERAREYGLGALVREAVARGA